VLVSVRDTQTTDQRTAFQTTVSPSPRDLFVRLLDDEKVAIDLILQDPENESLALEELVGDPDRRGYIRTLAAQLRALGFSLGESTALDRECEGWQEVQRRYEVARERADERRQEANAREQLRVQALPPDVRKAVTRHHRRQLRRGERPR
jgi:hypothetical protein